MKLSPFFSGRGGYHRSASYSDEHSGENRSGGFPYYGRGGGAAGSGGGGGAGGGGGDHWAPADGGTGGGRGGGVGTGGGGGAYTPTGPPGGGGSRASRDGNWRSPSTPQTDDAVTNPEWGSHWHPPPSPASTYDIFCTYDCYGIFPEVHFLLFSWITLRMHETYRTLTILFISVLIGHTTILKSNALAIFFP